MDITSFYCRIIERELSRSNVDLADLYKGTGLWPNDVHELSQVNDQQFTIFLGNALEVSGNPGLGLLVGVNTRLAGFGDMGIAALAAPTILDGLQVLESYSHLHSGLSKLFLKVTSLGLELSVQHYIDNQFSPIFSEVFVLLVQNYLQEIRGDSFTQGHYSFAYPRPEYSQQYNEVMHCPVEFNCAHTRMKIPTFILRERSPYYDAKLWRQSLQQCADRLAIKRESESATYAAHVLSLLGSHYLPLPSLKDIASRLCLSDRSLSRKLQEEGATFRRLCNQVMKARASELLKNTGLSVDAVAADLGYMDTANFRRAFKAWHGCSPSEYRVGVSD